MSLPFDDATNTTYIIIESRSNCGKHRLIDNQRYSYCKKKTNGEFTLWNCTVCKQEGVLYCSDKTAW